MVAASQQSAARAMGPRAGSSFKSYPRNARAPGNGMPRHHSDHITAKFSSLSVRVAASGSNSGSAGDEISVLNDENAALRATLQARLDKLDEAQRKAFYAEHAELAELGTAAGVSIPPLDGAPPPPPAPKKEKKIKAAAPSIIAEASPAPVIEAPVVMKDAGVSAVVEIDRDNTLVFKFGTFESPSLSVANASKASSMAADGLPANGAVRRGRTSKAAGATGGDSEEETKIYKFDAKIAASVPAAVGASSAVSATTAAIPAADASSGSSGSESDGDGNSTKSTTRRRKSTSSTSSTTTKSAAKKSTSAKKADPFAAARAAATAEAQSHSPATSLEGKEDWLYATVPATPVAGALCTFYYNKAQSEVLRQSPRIQLQARFNNWELEPAGDAPDRLDMIPAAEGAPRGNGSDFYSVSFTVPTEAYEFNFIFSDGEGVYDNNNTQNYTLPVEGPVTKESWIDTAPERAEAAYLARKEAERVAAEKAAAERETAALAADAQRAENAISELKSSFTNLREGALDLKSDQHKVRISSPATGIATAGSKITLMYNRTAPGGALSGIPIPADQSLTLKIGHNGWKSPQDIEMQRAPASSASTKSTSDGTAEWWHAVIQVPQSAAALNFVVNYYEHFDNNNAADYKIAVELPSNAKSVEAWADNMLKDVLKEITASRHAEEKAAADLEKARAAAREGVRAKTEEVRRKQLRHVLYTEPSAPAAGKELTIAYNPSNTNLNGAQRVFIKGGYNRWTHPKGYGPIEMTPPASGASHFTAVVSVPKDAYSLDFIFSDVVDGDGRYDNRGGLDYHMPVEGSVVGEPPLYVVHVAAEMAPIAKVGGLGDVVTALGRAVQEAGNQVEVILPRYDFFLQSPLLGGTQYETEFEWEGQRVFVSSCIVEGLRCWFIEPSNGMFATSTVYQGASDAAKFSWFSRAALEFLLRTQRQPDIIHCHDWSTAEVARNYWTNYHIYGLWKPKVIFTIHNLNYGAAAIGEAAYYSQRFTTVSPSYAGEIGGHPAIASNCGKLSGIRNGIDIDIWNPETDQFLPKGYTADIVEAGKAAARKALRQRVGLTEWGDKPLVGVVTRLTKQKGTHLIAHSAFRAMDRGAQFVLLGSAPDPKVQAEFDSLAQQYGGDNAAFCFAFDEPLSHLIYAACDMILVPSMFEPCGLTQMIAMRYGAVPVVRSTGGLRDTVFDVDTDKARAAWELEGSTDWESDGVDQTNGFSFEGTDEGALDYAMNRALDAYYNDREWFRSLQERVMRQDWSWNKPAIDYIELYYAAMK